MKKVQRHVPATTTVEVFRLFKLRDLGQILRQSADPVINAIGHQVFYTANAAVEPYVDEQNAASAKSRFKLVKGIVKKVK